MPARRIARAAKMIPASRTEVWEALTSPAAIKEYMFGAEVATDWRVGGPIEWKGQWQGKPYRDKGTILQVIPGRVLRYTHFSPLAGMPDRPENYHTVAIELKDMDGGTEVALSQDGNATEEARAHSEKNWAMMLDALAKYLAGPGGPSASIPER